MKKVDGRKNNGGHPNSGRKPKADEEKVNNVMLSAMREFYKVDTDEDAKKGLVKELLESQRGQIFISEHIFGKAKERVEATHNVTNFNLKDVIKFKE